MSFEGLGDCGAPCVLRGTWGFLSFLDLVLPKPAGLQCRHGDSGSGLGVLGSPKDSLKIFSPGSSCAKNTSNSMRSSRCRLKGAVAFSLSARFIGQRTLCRAATSRQSSGTLRVPPVLQEPFQACNLCGHHCSQHPEESIPEPETLNPKPGSRHLTP